MIRLRIDLVPNGNEKRLVQQATAEIVCVSARGQFRDYKVAFGEGQNPCASSLDWSDTGSILAHDQRASIWTLVEKVARLAVAASLKAKDS